MAGGMDLGEGGKGRKKPLDVAINLVPFIDLMAVTIVFLIMTAVWTQVGRMQVTQAGQSGEPTATDVPPLPPITVSLTATEWRVSVGGSLVQTGPLTHSKQGALDLAPLTGHLTALKAQWPDQTALTLTAEDTVPYEDLVAVLDACLGAAFPSVAVASAN